MYVQRLRPNTQKMNEIGRKPFGAERARYGTLFLFIF